MIAMPLKKEIDLKRRYKCPIAQNDIIAFMWKSYKTYISIQNVIYVNITLKSIFIDGWMKMI